ncbi:MAG TPA: SRPBCC domain-containing protein [Planctomycetota bacterium]|nr:SRPBCC domain-containing protein [Planctomycetota bacterium]
MPSPITANELLVCRTIDAQPERVWAAWTEAPQLQRWWGPEGYTCPSCSIDLRVGGSYLICMRSPRGQDFWSTGTYEEIVPRQRLICSDSFADEDGDVVSPARYGMPAEFPTTLHIVVSLMPLPDGATEVMVEHIGLPPGELRDQCEAGWNESLDKLEDHLAQEQE